MALKFCSFTEISCKIQGVPQLKGYIVGQKYISDVVLYQKVYVNTLYCVLN